jgi:iron(III) transport system substrate-binding protein
MLSRIGLAAVVALGALSAGATLPGTATPAFAQEIPALADISDSAEKARVEELIKAAKAEGKFEWIGAFFDPEVAARMDEGFKEYYGLKDVSVEYTYVGTAELVTRVEQLLKADKNNFDIVWTTAWDWYKDLLKRNELLKYDSPNYAAYTLSNEAGMSVDGYWVSDAYAFAPLYNPKVLAEHGLDNFTVTSWGDFLNPKLKGLVSMGNVLESTSYAPAVQGIVKVMGKDWLSNLAKDVAPILYTRAAQARDWVATGEYPIGMLVAAKHAEKLLQDKVDVKLVYPKEGTVLLPFAPVILQKAPHPNLAKLFIDYVRSAKGAQAVNDAGALLFMGRPGIKSSNPELVPSWEDIDVIKMDWDVDGTREAIEKVRADFKDAGLGY